MSDYDEPSYTNIVGLVADACIAYLEGEFEEAEGHFKELILVAAHFCQLSKERQ